LLAAPGALLYTRSTDGAAADALRRRGAELVALPPAGDRLDLAALLADLTRRQTNEVHLEGGARLNGSWLQAGLVDELVVYMAPKLLGDGAPLAVLAPLGDLQAAASFDLLDLERFGPDLRLRLRPPTAAPARWRDDRKQPRT
jgi:diaminohydroxyphosphoribosylaminopyrimidine deaminase/5-amino-6-(5-phosphoribosylamino)uracil reductase